MFIYQYPVNRSLWSKNQTKFHHNTKTLPYPRSSTGTKTIVRPGHFAETIVIVTGSFPQNVNDDKDTSFPQHFPSKINVGLCRDCKLYFGMKSKSEVIKGKSKQMGDFSHSHYFSHYCIVTTNKE